MLCFIVINCFKVEADIVEPCVKTTQSPSKVKGCRMQSFCAAAEKSTVQRVQKGVLSMLNSFVLFFYMPDVSVFMLSMSHITQLLLVVVMDATRLRSRGYSNNCICFAISPLRQYVLRALVLCTLQLPK